jgi:hypothetical protein
MERRKTLSIKSDPMAAHAAAKQERDELDADLRDRAPVILWRLAEVKRRLRALSQRIERVNENLPKGCAPIVMPKAADEMMAMDLPNFAHPGFIDT